VQLARRPLGFRRAARSGAAGCWVDQKTTHAIVDENAKAGLDGLRSALALLALLGVISLFFTKRIPEHQPGAAVVRPPG
jgi:hypothetical protein